MTNKAGVTHEYNAQELLKKVGATTEMYWDTESRRLQLTTAGGAYYFVYDPTAGIPAVLLERRPTSDVVYIREPDGSLLARIGPSGVKYYHFDHLGSTVCMTDSGGTVTDRYDYGSWGEPHPLLVGTTDNAYLYVGQLGYYAHWQDPSLSDMLQLGSRFYEPGAGRLTQEDPVREGWNWYAYAENQPARYIDPSGLKCRDASRDCKVLVCLMKLRACMTGDPVSGAIESALRGRVRIQICDDPSDLGDDGTVGDYGWRLWPLKPLVRVLEPFNCGVLLHELVHVKQGYLGRWRRDKGDPEAYGYYDLDNPQSGKYCKKKCDEVLIIAGPL